MGRSARPCCVLVCLLMLAACAPAAERSDEAAAPPTPTLPAALPAPPPPLGRTELLTAVATAAHQAAAGEAGTMEGALGGRRFALRLPFGCGGPSAEGAAVGYRYDADARTLALRAAPEDWTEEDWVRRLFPGQETEAIRGFWLRRPWLMSEGCPASAQASAVSDAAPPPAPAPETVGLVQLFDADGSRLERRGGRPYEVTRRVEADEAPGPQGFRLVLQGRITPSPDPIRCRVASPDQRPVCLVQVEFDRVAFEDPAGKTLAEWSS